MAFHKKRADSACGGLRFDMGEVLAANSAHLSEEIYRAKLIYDERGEFVRVDFSLYTAREMTKFRLVDVDFSYDKKYLDRSEIDAAFHRREGSDEIIMMKNSLATDTSIANIAIFDGENWLTPRMPLLEGTTRARLIESGFLQECDVSESMLFKAKKFAILNAMISFREIVDFEILK